MKFIENNETMIVAIVGSLLEGRINEEIQNIDDNSMDPTLSQDELKVILTSGQQYKIKVTPYM